MIGSADSELSLKQKFSNGVIKTLQSRVFYAASLILFIGESLWIALSGRYSMAYDENTHMSIIQLYSHKLLPFWFDQPPPGSYGAVSSDPSYMYHYLLSFPYRLFSHFFVDQTTQVIFLRLFSIVFFVFGLMLVRRLLLQVNVSRALANALVVFLVLTPLIPFLAAQINYDNLLFPITILAIIWSVRFDRELRSGVINVKLLLLLLSVCLFGSLVMSAFIPIFIAISSWFTYRFWCHYRQLGYRRFSKKLKQSLKRMSIVWRVALITLVVLISGLFIERYGINIIRFHTPLPSCEQVISEDICKLNGPWLREHQLNEQKAAGQLSPARQNPFSYFFGTWLRIMSYQMFYAVNGQIKHFKVGAPLPLPMFIAIIIGVVGAVLILLNLKHFIKNDDLLLLMFVAVVYVSFLLLKNYTEYLRLGQALGIQGRYLMPILPIVYLIFGLGWRSFLKKKIYYKALLSAAAIAILAFQGGGAMVFIIRSDENWYWENHKVIEVNKNAQRFLKAIVIGS